MSIGPKPSVAREGICNGTEGTRNGTGDHTVLFGVRQGATIANAEETAEKEQGDINTTEKM
jgi:hypothetical protein